MTRPCLVYVRGPAGPCPQVWHDPLVTPGGALAVKPEGIEIVAGPYQLPDPSPTVFEAVEHLRRMKQEIV